MNSQQLIVMALMLVLVGISVWFGHRITIESLTEEKTNRFKDKAFNQAKAEYLEYFHKRYTGTAEKLAGAYNAELLRENEALKKLNKELEKKLEKEKKAHENTGSN